jgi:hypothetical protein
MNNFCECGHLPSEHYGDTGRCEGQAHDIEYGTYPCLCYFYVKDSDD